MSARRNIAVRSGMTDSAMTDNLEDDLHYAFGGAGSFGTTFGWIAREYKRSFTEATRDGGEAMEARALPDRKRRSS